jgi:hypothetical protein
MEETVKESRLSAAEQDYRRKLSDYYTGFASLSDLQDSQERLKEAQRACGLEQPDPKPTLSTLVVKPQWRLQDWETERGPDLQDVLGISKKENEDSHE